MAMYFQHNLSDDEFLSKLEAIDPALAKRVGEYGINQWVKSGKSREDEIWEANDRAQTLQSWYDVAVRDIERLEQELKAKVPA